MKESNTIMTKMNENPSTSYDPDRYLLHGETLPPEPVDINPLPPTSPLNQTPPETNPDDYLKHGEQIFP